MKKTGPTIRSSVLSGLAALACILAFSLLGGLWFDLVRKAIR